MKFQTTLAFTLLLLVAMVGAGTVSALYGFTLGYDALQGVKQPEANPSQQLLRSRRSNKNTEATNGLELVSERKVIVQVYDFIQAEEKVLVAGKGFSEEPKNNFVKLPDSTVDVSVTAVPDDGIGDVSFPLSNTAGDIAIDVNDSRLAGNYWVMDVDLRNDSRESVRFLYNFLELRDDQGRLVSGQTEGLPVEIPANNQRYSGQIRIPAVILEEVETIFLSLSNYPDQNITLEIPDIPVVR